MDGFRQLESDMKKSAMVIFFNKKFMHKNIILDPNDNKVEFWLPTFLCLDSLNCLLRYVSTYSHDLAIESIMHCIHTYFIYVDIAKYLPS